MLYSNSASNPIIYNVSNEQFHEGFRQHFKPCLKALCPGAKCREEEGTSNTKETDCVSLVYAPKGRISDAKGSISDANENDCQMSSLNNNCNGIEVIHGPTDTRLSCNPTCTAV